MDEPVHVRAGRLRPWAAAGCRAPATTAAVRWCPTGWTAVLDRLGNRGGSGEGSGLGIRIPFLGSQGATQILPNHIEMVFDVVLMMV